MISLLPVVQRFGLDLVARLPQNAISRAVGRASRIERPRRLARLAVRTFAGAMGIDLREAERRPEEYASVHDFFIRRLKAGARRVDQRPEVLCSPCDGVVGEFGIIEEDTCIQAKGRGYSLTEFLKDVERARAYEGGLFVTVYLSPRHYHRVHSPVAGVVERADHVPGALLPVNLPSINHFDGVFVKNERLTTWIDSESFGRVAVVMVGATCVGEISAAYDVELATNQSGTEFRRKLYAESPKLAKGGELGIFHMGSTVVMLLPPGKYELGGLERGAEVRMGQALIALERQAGTTRSSARARRSGTE